MGKYLKIILIVIVFLAVISFLPVAGLYLSREPAPYTNAKAIEMLKPNNGEDFRFAVISDNHAGLAFCDGVILKIVRRINRANRFDKVPLDFVVSAGDITFRGSPWQFKIFNILRSRIKFPVICTAGNHDDDTKSTKSLFKQYCGQNEFSFVNRNSYFIIVDNTINDLTNRQLNWLEAELAKSAPYKHRFIIMHKPPVSPYQNSWYRPELSSWSDRFLKLSQKYKVDIVFSGHEHIFHRSSYGGVRYITTGGAGMLSDLPTSGGGYNHFVVVRVLGDYVDYEVRKIFPPLWEYLTYYLWKDIFYALKDVFI